MHSSVFGGEKTSVFTAVISCKHTSSILLYTPQVNRVKKQLLVMDITIFSQLTDNIKNSLGKKIKVNKYFITSFLKYY